jgi:hypothetical protein
MVSKVLKALAAVAVLVLLCFPVFQHSVPKTLWVVLFLATLTYGISLFLSAAMPPHRRWAIAYLAFVGLTYLLAGAWGLLRNGDLIEAAMWDSLISPYPLLTLMRHGIPRSRYATEWGNIYVLPLSEHHLFSITVIVISLLAIVAAFMMAGSSRTGYRIWLALVSLSIIATAGYVTLGLVRWGAKDAIIPVVWAASYVAAYLMARSGAGLQSPQAQARRAELKLLSTGK